MNVSDMAVKAHQRLTDRGVDVDLRTVDACFRAFLDVFRDSLLHGYTVTLPTVGRLYTTVFHRTKYHNPQNPSEKIILPPRLVVKFKPAFGLKNELAAQHVSVEKVQ